MLNKKIFNCITAIAIVLLVLFSGCVSEPSAPTPAQTETPALTPVPTQDTPVPTTVTPTPVAETLAIKVTSYPSSANGDTDITIRWDVSGGIQGEITHTAVHWGYQSGSANISDYPRTSQIQTGKTPQGFSAEIMVPAGGNFYFRAHATVDGVDVYSPEYQIAIIAPMGGGY